MKEKPSIALHVDEEDDASHTDSWRIEQADQVDFLDSPLILVRFTSFGLHDFSRAEDWFRLIQVKHTCLNEKAILKIAPVIEASEDRTITYSIFAYADANLCFRHTAKKLPFEVVVSSTPGCHDVA